MAPILHLMRHGQGYHSEAVTKDGHLLRDPHLTEKGIAQCKTRCAEFDRHDKIELLLASPLRRAIQTCANTFAPVVARGQKIVALPAAEEVSSTPSDTGSPEDVLRSEFGDLVDLSHLGSKTWYEHAGEYATDPSAVHARARKLRRWIREREESEVALVSHGYFAHYLIGEVDKDGVQTTPWWGETELRTYKFVDGDEDEASLVETEESIAKRGGEKENANGAIMNDPTKRGQSDK